MFFTKYCKYYWIYGYLQRIRFPQVIYTSGNGNRHTFLLFVLNLLYIFKNEHLLGFRARKANKSHPEIPVIARCHSYSINTKYTYECSQCGYR